MEKLFPDQPSCARATLAARGGCSVPGFRSCRSLQSAGTGGSIAGPVFWSEAISAKETGFRFRCPNSIISATRIFEPAGVDHRRAAVAGSGSAIDSFDNNLVRFLQLDLVGALTGNKPQIGIIIRWKVGYGRLQANNFALEEGSDVFCRGVRLQRRQQDAAGLLPIGKQQVGPFGARDRRLGWRQAEFVFAPSTAPLMT